MTPAQTRTGIAARQALRDDLIKPSSVALKSLICLAMRQVLPGVASDAVAVHAEVVGSPWPACRFEQGTPDPSIDDVKASLNLLADAAIITRHGNLYQLDAYAIREMLLSSPEHWLRRLLAPS